MNGWGVPGALTSGYDDIVTARTGIILIDGTIEGEWDFFRNAFSHIILPASILGYYSLAYIARMIRRDVILDQWWVATIPGLAIFIVSLGFNLLKVHKLVAFRLLHIPSSPQSHTPAM